MYHHGVMPWQHHYGMDSRDNHPEHICGRYKNYYVIAFLADGSQMEGIIDDVDEDGMTLLVPEVIDENELDYEMDRLYGGFGGYGGYGGYRRRFRRFRRRRFPYFQFVFPFVIPFPFYF